MKEPTEIVNTIPTYVRKEIEQRIVIGPTMTITNYQFEEPVKLPLTRKERRALSRKK